MISAQFNTHRFPMTIVNRTSMPVLLIAASVVCSLLGAFIKLMGWAGYTPLLLLGILLLPAGIAWLLVRLAKMRP